jgi:hypothetical protein
MKLAQILEARYYGNPIINFIQKVEVGTDDYTQFPRDEIPQVADAITRVYGQPKHEPRRTSFGGDAWREWYWEVDNPESYLNIYITIPKRAKGEKRVARLGVENYEYENDPDEHRYMDEAVAGQHPVFDFIEQTQGLEDIDIDPRDVESVVNALTNKFGKPRYDSDDDSIFDDEKETRRWKWGDHAFEGTDFEIELYLDMNDNTAWIEVQRWRPDNINEAKYYRDHPVVQWIKDVMEFLRVNQLLTVHVKDADEAIKAIGYEYGPPLAIGSDYSEWNIETDVHGGRLYHLEVRDKAQGGSVNLTRVI